MKMEIKAIERTRKIKKMDENDSCWITMRGWRCFVWTIFCWLCCGMDGEGGMMWRRRGKKVVENSSFFTLFFRLQDKNVSSEMENMSERTNEIWDVHITNSRLLYCVRTRSFSLAVIYHHRKYRERAGEKDRMEGKKQGWNRTNERFFRECGTCKSTHV